MSAALKPPGSIHSRGSGPAVVLLHCLGVDAGMWNPIAESLASRFTVISYDLPGHGASEVPSRPYAIEDLAEQLYHVLQSTGIARAHVVGMSLGGLVAQAFASRYPESTRCAVLVDTTPQYPPALKDKWVERATIARSAGVGPLIEEKLTIWFTPEFVAAGGPVVRYVRETLGRCSGEGYALACEALGAADLRESVGRIAAPTLILLGEGDLPPFHDAARWMQAQIPDSRVELIPQARHAAPLEQPFDVAGRLLQFLNSSR